MQAPRPRAVHSEPPAPHTRPPLRFLGRDRALPRQIRRAAPRDHRRARREDHGRLEATAWAVARARLGTRWSRSCIATVGATRALRTAVAPATLAAESPGLRPPRHGAT